MQHTIVAYLKFLLKSSNHHGVHSPFVYNLVTKCFYDSQQFKAYEQLKHYRKSLLKNHEILEITDFGAGSKKFKNNHRKISDLCKHVSITTKNAKFLYRLVNYLKPTNSLELGTSLGLASQAISLATTNGKLTTIEGCPNITRFTKSQFSKNRLTNIELTTGDFIKVIPTLKNSNFDLIYFDGNHSKEATLNYFEMLLPKTTNETVFIFDDIYWSKGMTQAWETVKQDSKVTVTIDTFSWGMAFFRKEQAKEHFYIRL